MWPGPEEQREEEERSNVKVLGDLGNSEGADRITAAPEQIEQMNPILIGKLVGPGLRKLYVGGVFRGTCGNHVIITLEWKVTWSYDVVCKR